jgi:hypothetical protein
VAVFGVGGYCVGSMLPGAAAVHVVGDGAAGFCVAPAKAGAAAALGA